MGAYLVMKNLRYLLSAFLKINFSGKLYDEFLLLYNQICLELYGKASFTNGLTDFLNQDRSIKYVASGGDQEELRRVFLEKGILHFFSDILGSPSTKEEIVLQILRKVDIERSEIVFIGDSMKDLEVALKFKLKPVFMIQYSDNRIYLTKFCRKNNIMIINNLQDML